MPIPKKDLMAANHKKNTEGGRKKRGYYLTDEENEKVAVFIASIRKQANPRSGAQEETITIRRIKA